MTKTIFNAIKTWVRHNQSLFISLILSILFGLWFFGCKSTTQSILDPTLKVTEDILNVEYTSELARLNSELATLRSTTEVRLQDLHKQDAFKQALFENAQLIVAGNNPNPLGILSLIGTIFGIGAIIDNRKKDGLIKGLQSKTE